MIDLSELNENQKQAVLAPDQYLRIIAGAGSGKTRVLTTRIARLIDEGMPAARILAITFTNKAANEMKDRISRMVPEESGRPWISTIHSLCVRILREDINTMDWPRNFTVLDAEDQKSILKEAYKQFRLDASSHPYAMMLDYIASCKSAEISVARACELAGSYSGEKAKAQVYEFYLKRQQDLYALDFDDLILWTVRMFRTYPEVLAKWQRRYQAIHVDEFQDIDKVQYQLIRQLTGTKNTLCVVGDPDQTIYTWRGADVNIILNFNKDFPGARTITLNENYRSTSAILNGANSVIRNNRHRLEKDLFTRRQSEEKITHYAAVSDTYEAAWVAARIKDLHRQGKPYKDMAVLYRSNYLSRSLEKGLLDERIPYIIYGGVRFYERAEVKDALCYLRMVTTGDDLALNRIINRPKRGVGQKTMDKLAAAAAAAHASMYDTLKASPSLFSGRMQKTMADFVNMIERWRKLAEAQELEVFKLFELIIQESGLKAMLEDAHEEERVENLKELIDDVKEFFENFPDATLEEYLQQVSLYGDREETLGGDFVQLMTVHAAKGLEFDTVFVTDLNEGIFPNERAMNDGSRGVEEERRLAYVAFTRARNKLYLTEAGGFSYILQRTRTTSRFIKEIDEAYIEHQGSARQARNPFAELTGDPSEHAALSAGLDEEDVYEQRLSEAAKVELEPGEQVLHDVFGKGIVLKCENGIAEIAFPYPHGVKKLLASHPSLKRVKELN